MIPSIGHVQYAAEAMLNSRSRRAIVSGSSATSMIMIMASIYTQDCNDAKLFLDHIFHWYATYLALIPIA